MSIHADFSRRFGRILRHVAPVVAGILVIINIVVFSDEAGGQQLPNLSADQLQRLQQQYQQGRGSAGTAGEPLTSQVTILEPNTQQGLRLPPSRLEQLLSERAGTRLQQFGYDQLGVGRPVVLPQMGAIQDDYVLGPGDEIVVSLRGQENSEYRVAVDRDGRVVLPRLNPVPAAGRTFAQFREDLTNAIHRAYVSTDGFVSVGRVRQVNVLVSGEVNSPGVRTLTGLSTTVDAILVSGGIKKTGSLRNVHIIRGGREITVDLYGVLTGLAHANSAALTDGDRIVVPPLGRTVAVVGWVRRPAIYELPPGRSAMGTQELLSLAGGLEVRGKYRLSVLRVAADGRNQMLSLERGEGSIGDSDILFVQPAASESSSMATLSGGTALAGKYAAKSTKLSEILKSPGALGQEPYTLFGIISRRDPSTLLRTLISFTPVAVLKGSEDMEIQSDDIVRVISTKEARVLFSALQLYRLRRQATEEALRNPRQRILANGFGVNAPGTGTNFAENPEALGAGMSARQALASPGGNYYPQSPGMQPYQPDQNRPDLQTGANPYGANPQQYPQQYPQQQNTQQYPQLYTDPNQQYPQQYPDEYSQPNPSQQQTYPGGQYQGGGYGANQYPSSPYLNNRFYDRQKPFTQNLEEAPIGNPEQIPTNVEVSRINDLANQLRVDSLVLVNFLDDRAVNVDGAVQGPGTYLVGPDAELASVLAAAGGLARWSDRSSVEVISTSVDSNTAKAQTVRRSLSLVNGADAAYIISPHDEVRVNEVFTAVGLGSITLQGEVRHPGTFQIVRGEHLSEVLMRAGGLTESAYPYGTVFLRRSAAEREQDSFRRAADEIQTQLMVAMSRRDPNSKLSPDAFTAMQTYVAQLRNQKPLGRMTVTADPAVLVSDPGRDPLLEPGDLVYIPPRPYAVAILGEVLQPGSVPFASGMSASDYVKRAGGYSQFADSSETILVLPDGSARRVESSWFNFSSSDIPPGSTIYVARDVSGLDTHQIILDTTQIFSQLAVTAASLAVLAKQ